MRTAFAPQVLNKGQLGIVPPQVLTLPPCTPTNSSPLMLAPRSCSDLPLPSLSLLPLTVTAREPPDLEPPELEPPELEVPELEVPELEPLAAWTVKLLPVKAAPPGAITASCCVPSGASAGTVAVIS